MQVKEVVNDTPFEENLLGYNPSTETVRTNNSDLQQLIAEIEHMDPNYKIFTHNLTKDETASVTELRENKKIILVTSDKEGDG